MDYATRLGARIRAYRLAKGLSASGLALRAGVTENAIRKIESGDSKEPRFTTGLRIASALGVNPNELISADSRAGGQVPSLALALRRIRERHADLAKLGVAHVAIFGSVARGEATDRSDVDVIIKPRADRRFTLFDLVATQEQLEKALGSRVDVVTATTLRQSRWGCAAEAESVHVF